MNAFAPPALVRACSPAAALAVAAVFCRSAHVPPARATTIQRVTSPGGIEAWLVQEPAVPLIAIDFAFEGGSVQDPEGKTGTANLVASLLDEGAGNLDFQGVYRSARTQRHRNGLLCRPRQPGRLDAHADRRIVTKLSTCCVWR